MAKSKWHEMSEEQKQKHRDGNVRRRQQRAEWSDERKERYRRKAKERYQERMASMTTEERTALRSVQRDKERERNKKYKRDGKGHFHSWANAIKERAKRKNVPCDIDADFLQEIMPTHCPVLGTELRRGTGRSSLPCSPTLDRIFPDRGYVRDNVIVVSKRANQIKSDATPEEIRRVADFYDALCEGLKDL